MLDKTFFKMGFFPFLGIFLLLIVIYFKMKAVSNKWIPEIWSPTLLLYDLSVDFIYGPILAQHFGGKMFMRP